MPQRPRGFGYEDPRCWDLRPQLRVCVSHRQLRVCGDVTCVSAVSRSERSNRFTAGARFSLCTVSELQLAVESETTVLQICSTGELRKAYDPQKLCSCIYMQTVRLFPQQYIRLQRPKPIQPMYLFTMQSPGAVKQKGACPGTMGCLSLSALRSYPILSK